MTKYELLLILLPHLGEDETKKELDEVRKLIGEGKGSIDSEDIWGIRELTYRIKKQDEGYYIVIDFNIGPDKIQELEKALNIHHSVIRFLILKTPDNYQTKTFKEYQEEAVRADKEEQAKKKEAEDKKPARKVERVERVEKKIVKKAEKVEEKPKKATREEPKEDPKEELKEDPKEEPKEEPVKEKESSNLEDLDAKLKRIIDDPDISL